MQKSEQSGLLPAKDAAGRTAHHEMAYITWHAHGAHGIDTAVCALEEALSVQAAMKLSPENVSLLGQALQRCGSNFHAVIDAMGLDRSLFSALPQDKNTDNEVGKEAQARCGTKLRLLLNLVEAYYSDYYVTLGFCKDDMRFAPLNSVYQRAAGERRQESNSRRIAVQETLRMPKNMAEMIACGIVAPGEHVLSAVVCPGSFAFADLLPSGLIRYE